MERPKARVGWRSVTLIHCHMCGKAYPNDQARADACSTECSARLDVLHHRPDTHRLDLGQWSHVSRVLMIESLIGENPQSPSSGAAAVVSPKDADEEARFREAWRSMVQLSQRLYEARAALSAPEQDPRLQTWAKKVDGLMRDLDKLLSADVSNILVEHLAEFHSLHTEAVARGDPNAQLLTELRGFMTSLARSIPENRVMLQKRDLLKRFLKGDNALCIEDRLVMTFDGGGVKGVVPLLILVAIQARLRELSGIATLRIEDCVDLLVGTSTGGIIAAGLGLAGKEAIELLNLYKTMGNDIFGELNKVHDWKIALLCKYGDLPFMRVMLDIFGAKRLDDPSMHFIDEDHTGPTGVRVALTTANLVVSSKALVLLRNYEMPPDDELYTHPQLGTSGVYAAEALRCTTAAPTFLHPYGRHYAPIEVRYNAAWQSISSGYLKVRGKRVTNMDLILQRLNTPEEVAQHNERIKGDVVMNAIVGGDGGTVANNPERVALLEARRLFGAVCPSPAPSCAIHLVSFGTGKLPATPNPIWNTRIIDPATRPLMGRDNFRESISSLIKYGFALPSTETEETDASVRQLSGDYASMRRINPPLRRPVQLDDTSPDAMRTMVEDTSEWLASEVGKENVETVARDILRYSMRLRKRLAGRAPPKASPAP